MNTKQILTAMAIVAAMSATTAMAQDTPAAAPAASAATASATQGSSGHKGKGRHEMKFEDRKAHALKRLEKSAAKIQQKQACVQASTDKASLQACFPKRGEGKDKGGWHKHGGKGGADKSDTAAPAADAPAAQ